MPLHHVGLLLKSTTIDVANSGINGWLGCLGLTKSSIVARSLALAKWIVFPMACFRNCSLIRVKAWNRSLAKPMWGGQLALSVASTSQMME